MDVTGSTESKIRDRLRLLYGDQAQSAWERLQHRLAQLPPLPDRSGPRWDQRDAILITYADGLRADEPRPAEHDGSAGEPAAELAASQSPTPLQTLCRFLVHHQLTDVLSTVHLLPFSPYSSDDGFSVIDYRDVAPAMGTWDDIAELGTHAALMFDLVLNHNSSQSAWFQAYCRDQPPYDQFYIAVDPQCDLSAVTRPRSHPLLTEFETASGLKHVWTTFSADQVDLNFAAPEVLAEMIDILLFYVRQGARVIRLDAIAYLWKEIGTSCIHLPQTHEVVKLMRDLLEDVAPHVLLLTETNVPHKENVSYFGDGDEAHMVYQFSLPPLLLDALLAEEPAPLRRWLAALEPPPSGATFFNFTASHDGVGVRPLEGLVARERIAQLAAAAQQCGGKVSMRRTEDGGESPYELNVSYVHVLEEPALPPAQRPRRFLASQAFALGLQGIPGVYFHSLVGSPNDLEGMQANGQPRSINRHKYTWDELAERLRTDVSQRVIFQTYRRMLACRGHQPAFHPEVPQAVVPADAPQVVAYRRRHAAQDLVVAANFSSQPIDVRLPETSGYRDLLSDLVAPAEQPLTLAPYQVVWLSSHTEDDAEDES